MDLTEISGDHHGVAERPNAQILALAARRLAGLLKPYGGVWRVPSLPPRGLVTDLPSLWDAAPRHIGGPLQIQMLRLVVEMQMLLKHVSPMVSRAISRNLHTQFAAAPQYTLSGPCPPPSRRRAQRAFIDAWKRSNFLTSAEVTDLRALAKACSKSSSVMVAQIAAFSKSNRALGLPDLDGPAR